MASYDIWALADSAITVSGGGSLDGVTQGDGSHLVGRTITLNSSAFEMIAVDDGGADGDFDDNDGNQEIDGAQVFDGESLADGTQIEAEYQIILRDPATGDEYRAIGINFDNSNPQFGTVEGLAFVGAIPPVGIALTVVSASEGPGSLGQASLAAADLAVPCFTPGTRIETPDGGRAVEALRAGDTVLTLDNGSQALTWVGRTEVWAERLRRHPAFRPIHIRADAFGPGRPCRDMLVSPQHRILVSGWQAEVHFGEREALVAALHLVNGSSVTRAWDVTETAYVHLACARHEILISDGLPTESFNPGPMVLPALPEGARAQLRALFPDHDLSRSAPFWAARPLISGREAAALWL